MFTMKFETDNAAFDDGHYAAEVARILRNVADKVERGVLMGRIADANGNGIGKFEVTAGEEE